MFSLKIVKGQELASGAVTEMRLPAPPARLAIGRDPHVEWPLPDRTLALSARHCEIVVSAGGTLLRDLSTNGTFINGSPVRMMHDQVLAAGDQFEVGPYRIVVLSLKAGATADGAVDLLLTTSRPSPHQPAAATPVAPAARARGGDPAASAGVARQPLPAAPPPPSVATAAEDDSPLTRIRPPPRPSAAPPPAVAPTAPVPLPVASDSALLGAIATGLGVDVSAFGQRDPAEVARRLAAVARFAVSGLRRLLEQEARARRRLGSRHGTLNPIRDANPLRLARTPEDALVRLIASSGDDGGATLRDACDELAAHHEQLMAAFAGASRRLAEEMDPASLEGALGKLTLGGEERKAQLWDLYVGIWHRLGLAPDESWSRGFIDAAMLHLAAAYDEGSDEAHDAARP